MEDIKLLNENITDLELSNYDTSLIQDNKLVFYIEPNVYRVRMPSQSEQALTEQKRNIQQLKCMQEEGCITKPQLIQKLKESNVLDVEKLEKEKDGLIKELKNLWYSLATQDSTNINSIDLLKSKINEVQDNIKLICLNISTYLTPSLENRLEKFYVEYLTMLCTEKQINDGSWEKLWKDFNEFEQSDSVLTNKAIVNMTWLLLNRKV